MNARKSFTLIELLVVIAIIGMLAVLLFPTIGSSRERAKSSVCINNIRQIAVAAFLYADENNEAIPLFPTETSPSISDYTDDMNIFLCPSDKRDGLDPITKPSYTSCKYTPESLLPSEIEGLFSENVLYVESDFTGDLPDGLPPEQIDSQDEIAFRHKEMTCVVFCDGHALTTSEGQFVKLLTAFRGGREP